MLIVFDDNKGRTWTVPEESILAVKSFPYEPQAAEIHLSSGHRVEIDSQTENNIRNIMKNNRGWFSAAPGGGYYPPAQSPDKVLN